MDTYHSTYLVCTTFNHSLMEEEHKQIKGVLNLIWQWKRQVKKFLSKTSPSKNSGKYPHANKNQLMRR